MDYIVPYIHQTPIHSFRCLLYVLLFLAVNKKSVHYKPFQVYNHLVKRS